jgi:hypothetical protein
MARTLVEELTSADGTWKVQIWRRDDGTLRVCLLRWTDPPTSFWEEIRTAGSITDSMDIARTIGNDLLQRHADER